MSKIRKAIIKHVIMPITVGAIIGILLLVYFDWGYTHTWKSVFNQIIESIILTFLFWKGNEVFVKYIAKKYGWAKSPKTTLLKHSVFVIVYSLLVIFLFYLYVWFVLMHRKGLNGFFLQFRIGFYICFSITAIITLFAYAYNFFKYWKKSVLDAEQLKRESLAMQYESLKNQVNPHFLFNSLNVLTSLIERDREASIKYVKQLSDVFRYVLEQNVHELVPIETEIKFIESYIFLQQIRFDTKLKIEINISETDFRIVPMALQILLENAIKHNEISTENPLTISIFDDNQYIQIKNNKQPRANLPESNQIGLKTLEFQYEFLSGEKIIILNSDNLFIVKLPKIKNTDHAGSGN